MLAQASTHPLLALRCLQAQGHDCAKDEVWASVISQNHYTLSFYLASSAFLPSWSSRQWVQEVLGEFPR